MKTFLHGFLVGVVMILVIFPAAVLLHALLAR